MRLHLLLAGALVCSKASGSSPTELLSEAMKQAIRNVDMMNTVAVDTIGEEHQHPHMQRASAEAIEAQKIGDIMQETTRILISENGAAILAQLKGIVALATSPPFISSLPTKEKAYLASPSGDLEAASVESIWDTFFSSVVDALAELESQLHPEGEGRKKRQIVVTQLRTTTTVRPGTNQSAGTINTSNPLDESCIERPATCDPSFPYRSISGWCNHDDEDNRQLGSTMAEIRRFMGGTKYDDGFNSVRRRAARGGVLPSTRTISNKIFAEAVIPSFDPKYNHFLQQFGQWIAHDIVFTPGAVGPNGAALDCSTCESANISSNCAPIEVPADDAFFPPLAPNRRQACIRLTRAINGQKGLGPRAQINQNSHFLDLSQVYGSTDCIAKELRTGKDGQMIMYTEDGYNLPPRAANDTNCQSQRTTPPFLCFTAGDSRNSLHPGLIPMHTIYLRQHNKWAAQMRELRPTLSDETLYQETRRLMIALYQFHVFAEYLPKIIGQQKMREFNLLPSARANTYNPRIDPSVSVEFCSAAFRFGHSQVRTDIPRTTNNNVTVGTRVDLGNHIFYSDTLFDKTATVSTMTQGMVNNPGMAVDRQFSFPVRNEMFATRGRRASGVDLAAVNVQRGREKGVHPYNEVRARIPGLSSVLSFDALRRDVSLENIELLKQTYASVDDIDLYVGLLLERASDPTALLGPTGSHIIADQFSAFKRGDRFFYESATSPGALTQDEYNAIRGYSLAQLICENTDGMEQVQSDIFQHNNNRVPCNRFRPFPMAQIMF